MERVPANARRSYRSAAISLFANLRFYSPIWKSVSVTVFCSIVSFALTFAPAGITVQKRKTGQLLITELDRRRFLSHGIATLGATWTAAHWPAVLAAAEHAHHVALFPEDQKWEFFTAAE